MNNIKDHTYKDLLDVLNSYMDNEYVEFINKYYKQAQIVYAGMKRETGEDYILHPTTLNSQHLVY